MNQSTNIELRGRGFTNTPDNRTIACRFIIPGTRLFESENKDTQIHAWYTYICICTWYSVIVTRPTEPVQYDRLVCGVPAFNQSRLVIQLRHRCSLLYHSHVLMTSGKFYYKSHSMVSRTYPAMSHCLLMSVRWANSCCTKLCKSVLSTHHQWSLASACERWSGCGTDIYFPVFDCSSSAGIAVVFISSYHWCKGDS